MTQVVAVHPLGIDDAAMPAIRRALDRQVQVSRCEVTQPEEPLVHPHRATSQLERQLIPGIERQRVEVLHDAQGKFLRRALPQAFIGDGYSEPRPAGRFDDSICEITRIGGESFHGSHVEQSENVPKCGKRA
jgi:hypothetical protein